MSEADGKVIDQLYTTVLQDRDCNVEWLCLFLDYHDSDSYQFYINVMANRPVVNHTDNTTN